MTYDEKTYQILSLEVASDRRDFEVEKKRFATEKTSPGHVKTGGFHHLIFDHNKFSSGVPEGMEKGSDNFNKMRAAAGKAYAGRWNNKDMK